MFFDHLTWDAANKKCLSRGGHLVRVESMEEQAFIATKLLNDARKTSSYWMDLTRTKDGSWEYGNKQKAVFLIGVVRHL